MLRLHQAPPGAAMAAGERSRPGGQKDRRDGRVLRRSRLLRSRHTRQFSRSTRGRRPHGRSDDLLLRRHSLFLPTGMRRNANPLCFKRYTGTRHGQTTLIYRHDVAATRARGLEHLSPSNQRRRRFTFRPSLFDVPRLSSSIFSAYLPYIKLNAIIAEKLKQ